MLTPLFMLCIYTFVFGFVFKSRWSGTDDSASFGEFAVILFSGLIVFQLFSEVINRAPMLMIANANYVKRIVFPLELLVPVALGSALFHLGVSLIVLLVAVILVFGGIPWTALLIPVVLLPFSLVILGLSWFLASLGTYVRDIGQILGTITMALMFTSPIFFPASVLPEWVRPWLALNPLFVPVDQIHNIVVFGKLPDFAALGLYALLSIVIAFLGYWWFQKTRKGFADVL